MRLRDLKEAPIGDYAPIGNWGDNEKSNSFRNAQDRKLIQSPNLIKKVRKKFGNTEHILNFYFVNLPGALVFAEKGYMDSDQLNSNLPKAWELIQAREQEQNTDPSEAINVIFVGNNGINRVPMTSWIMAHRLGHAAESSGRGQRNHAWNEYERDFFGLMDSMLTDVYDVDMSRDDMRFSKEMAIFFQEIGTMASARNKKLGGRPYEFLYELFAQFITTGKLSFRELPKIVNMGQRKIGWRSIDEDAREMYSHDLNDAWGDQLTQRLDNVLYGATGKYLVM
jgi:hypothetical protein